jgi:hypothetical protein
VTHSSCRFSIRMFPRLLPTALVLALALAGSISLWLGTLEAAENTPNQAAAPTAPAPAEAGKIPEAPAAPPAATTPETPAAPTVPAALAAPKAKRTKGAKASKAAPAAAVAPEAAAQPKVKYEVGEDPEFAKKHGWPVKMPPTPSGAILPEKRIVAYYGNPQSKRMGALGEYPKDEMLQRLKKEVANWEKADPTTPVQPALHLVTVVAQGEPGKAGLYRMLMPDHIVNMALRVDPEKSGRASRHGPGVQYGSQWPETGIENRDL